MAAPALGSLAGLGVLVHRPLRWPGALCSPRPACPSLKPLASRPQEFYGDDAQKSRDYGRIVSSRHFQRVMGLLEGQKVACGGTGDAATRYIGVCPASTALCPGCQGPCKWQQVGTDTWRADNPAEGRASLG